jgi:hypothetical protein
LWNIFFNVNAVLLLRQLDHLAEKIDLQLFLPDNPLQIFYLFLQRTDLSRVAQTLQHKPLLFFPHP